LDLAFSASAYRLHITRGRVGRAHTLPWASSFVVGATALLLLSVGIHNAWDTVTYIAVEQAQTPQEREDGDERQ